MTFEQGGEFITSHGCYTGLSFCLLIRSTVPFSHLVWQARGLRAFCFKSESSHVLQVWEKPSVRNPNNIIRYRNTTSMSLWWIHEKIPVYQVPILKEFQELQNAEDKNIQNLNNVWLNAFNTPIPPFNSACTIFWWTLIFGMHFIYVILVLHSFSFLGKFSKTCIHMPNAHVSTPSKTL